MRHSTVEFAPGKERLPARRAPTSRHPGRSGPGSPDFEDAMSSSAASQECIIGKSAEPTSRTFTKVRRWQKTAAEIPHKSNISQGGLRRASGAEEL